MAHFLIGLYGEELDRPLTLAKRFIKGTWHLVKYF